MKKNKKRSVLFISLYSILTIIALIPIIKFSIDVVNAHEVNKRETKLDLSNTKIYNFEDKNEYGNLETDGWNITKEGHDYTLKLKGLDVAKLILPGDDADEINEETGDRPFHSKDPRETHITIILDGDNKINSYGIDGSHIKGLTITGSGSLSITSVGETVEETYVDVSKLTDEQRKKGDVESAKTTKKVTYTNPGIRIETDEIKEDDEKSGFIIENTGTISIDSPNYYGITCNGDINIKSGELKINSKREAISADKVIIGDLTKKEDQSNIKISTTSPKLFYDNGPTFVGGAYLVKAGNDEDSAEPKSISNVTNSYNSYKYISITPGVDTEDPKIEIINEKEDNIYCTAPEVVITDDVGIDSVYVDGYQINQKFTENTVTRKKFVVPSSNNKVRNIVVRDVFGNETNLEITITGHTFNDWKMVDDYTREHECTVCGYKEQEKVKVDISSTTISLSNESYVYDGNKKEPNVVVSINGKTLKKGTDYTLQYSNNKEVGTANVLITGINDYKGFVNKKFNITKAENILTASNITKEYSTKAQSFKIEVTQTANASLTFVSNNSNITVDSYGVVNIKAGYSGSANITIKASGMVNYNKAEKVITVTVLAPTTYSAQYKNTATTAVKKVNNSITASNFTKNYSTKVVSISIKAKQKGNAKLTYSSNNKNVKVNSSGKITVAKKFIGKATININANATTKYNKTNKKITVTVNPPSVKLSKLSNAKGKKMTVKWNKSTAVTGYQIQYSTDKKFKKNVKTVTVSKNSKNSTTISNLTKNKKYYVRIRTYKTVSKVKYYSSWSSVKNLTIKK